MYGSDGMIDQLAAFGTKPEKLDFLVKWLFIKCHSDNEEMGLAYRKDFDNIYEQSSNEIRQWIEGLTAEKWEAYAGKRGKMTGSDYKNLEYSQRLSDAAELSIVLCLSTETVLERKDIRKL